MYPAYLRNLNVFRLNLSVTWHLTTEKKKNSKNGHLRSKITNFRMKTRGTGTKKPLLMKNRHKDQFLSNLKVFSDLFLLRTSQNLTEVRKIILTSSKNLWTSLETIIFIVIGDIRIQPNALYKFPYTSWRSRFDIWSVRITYQTAKRKTNEGKTQEFSFSLPNLIVKAKKKTLVFLLKPTISIFGFNFTYLGGFTI